MKRIFAFILVFISLACFTLNASAQGMTDEKSNDNCQTTYLDDGSYIVISGVQMVEDGGISTRSINTRNAYNTATCYSEDDEVLWTYTLYASFAYETGVSVVCTNAWYEQNIYGRGWKFSDGAATAGSDYARGVGIFRHKVLFITNQTDHVDLYIFCDSYGNLS